jgi:hypothetical protein
MTCTRNGSDRPLSAKPAGKTLPDGPLPSVRPLHVTKGRPPTSPRLPCCPLRSPEREPSNPPACGPTTEPRLDLPRPLHALPLRSPRPFVPHGPSPTNRSPSMRTSPATLGGGADVHGTTVRSRGGGRFRGAGDGRPVSCAERGVRPRPILCRGGVSAILAWERTSKLRYFLDGERPWSPNISGFELPSRWSLPTSLADLPGLYGAEVEKGL